VDYDLKDKLLGVLQTSVERGGGPKPPNEPGNGAIDLAAFPGFPCSAFVACSPCC